MRLFRRFTSGESQAAAARCPDFLLAMASPLKKSLRAAERKRADVAPRAPTLDSGARLS
jgi:hypothetical protein